jgi:hypothetical protein
MSKRDRTHTKSGLPSTFWMSPSEAETAARCRPSPEMSDRAIAEDVGVSDRTDKRARNKSTATDDAVEKRTGRDGKARKRPKRAKTAALTLAKIRPTGPVHLINGLTCAGLLAQTRAVLGEETKARTELLQSARAARELIRRALANDPKPGADIEAAAAAAAIPSDVLMVAVDVPGVVTRRGEWRLPG